MIFPTKKWIDLDHVRALREAYEHPLMKKEIFTQSVIPALYVAFYMEINFYQWWLIPVGLVIGAVYGLSFIMTIAARRWYSHQAMVQRNRFANNIASCLIDEDAKVLSSLEFCAQEKLSEGEMRENLKHLIAELVDATKNEVRVAFTKFANTAKNDIVFRQLVEQVMMLRLLGRSKLIVGRIKDYCEWHNEVLTQHNEWLQDKEEFKNQFKKISRYHLATFALLTFGMGFSATGFNRFLDNYAHFYTGYLFGGFYLIIFAIVFHRFLKDMENDEIMVVKIWKK